MRLTILLGSALSVVVLAACGSSGSAKSSSSGSGSAAKAPSTTVSSSSRASAPGPPPVTNPTDLQKEPLPSAGTPPAPTRLMIKDLVVGSGAQPTASATVQVQYVGANYADGKVFDSSWQRGQPASFPVNGVIPGFAQAIEGMKVGGRREVVIPPALGYGASGSPPAVGPNETLVFIIDLLAIH